jgi:hypothetical protein
LRRAALFLWIMPFCAALSNALSARWAMTSASCSSPEAINLRVFLTYVRARERCTWLILRLRSELRMRLMADFVFANFFTPFVNLLKCGRHYSPSRGKSQTA